MSHTNDDRLYRALCSRDARFDGRIFVGVTSTGVYCRPICPARTPKRENVQFFACAAAAEQAGFRACRRCRPEASPGTPGWLGTSATVSRALRLIERGALDDGDVDTLATRLGVGDRHLRRLFAEHLGTTPIAVAQTRRTHFAKRLIDDTDLPMTKIAAHAGFSSVRRFNSAVQQAFGRRPTEMRRAARQTAPTVTSAESLAIELRLAYRKPLDWDGLLKYLSVRATPGVETVQRGIYRRTIRVGEEIGVIEVDRPRLAEPLRLRVLLDQRAGLLDIATRARALFDLDADPDQILSFLGQDAVIGPRVKANPGLRIPGCWDPFEIAVRAILGQQVSVAAATTLAGRLAGRYGEPLAAREDRPDSLARLFPTPERLARARLRSIGLTQARAATLNRFAAAVADGSVRLDAARDLEDTEAELTSIAGIGPWTAQYIAMRALREPDAFPVGDLGLRRAVSTNGHPATSRHLASLAEAWRPWRAYAAAHLWRVDASATRAPG